MTMQMINPPQITRSAQVWVCDACGCQDAKSCGCDSTAHLEELAASRERARKRQQKHREAKKANEINDCVTRDMDVDPIEEFTEADGEDESEVGLLEVRRRGFLHRASEALRYAQWDNLRGMNIDREMRAAVKQTAEAWGRLLAQMEVQNEQNKTQ